MENYIKNLSIPLKQMSVEDKLQAIEEIWADLAGTPDNIPAPSWRADVLNALEKRIFEGKSHFLDFVSMSDRPTV